MTFTEKLRRLTFAMNKAKVGRAAGLGPNGISAYICKGSIPRGDIAQRLASTLGVSCDWLLDASQDWPPVRVGEPMEAYAA